MVAHIETSIQVQIHISNDTHAYLIYVYICIHASEHTTNFGIWLVYIKFIFSHLALETNKYQILHNKVGEQVENIHYLRFITSMSLTSTNAMMKKMSPNQIPQI